MLLPAGASLPAHPASISPADLWSDVQAFSQQSPLVHSVTQFVVMNFYANRLLAAGTSPLMAHAVEEAPDVIAIARALVGNIETLDQQWVPATALALQTTRSALQTSRRIHLGQGQGPLNHTLAPVALIPQSEIHHAAA